MRHSWGGNSAHESTRVVEGVSASIRCCLRAILCTAHFTAWQCSECHLMNDEQIKNAPTMVQASSIIFVVVHVALMYLKCICQQVPETARRQIRRSWHLRWRCLCFSQFCRRRPRQAHCSQLAIARYAHRRKLLLEKEWLLISERHTGTCLAVLLRCPERLSCCHRDHVGPCGCGPLRCEHGFPCHMAMAAVELEIFWFVVVGQSVMISTRSLDEFHWRA